MGRKRKNPLKKLKPNETGTCNKNLTFASEINKIIILIQTDLTSQKQFIREIRQIYAEVDHDEFMKFITKILMFFMQEPEDDNNAKTVLQFLCNFLATYKDDENENPCRSIFNFILNTDGSNPHIRFRLCELMNILLVSLGDAALHETVCDRILRYMLNRLKNSSAHVRAQAIYALERLQVPNDPDDIVINYFIYHMQADPSAKVREAVIRKIARNTKTLPLIIDRLQDSEERVRRHTYIEMMKGFPVKSLRIAQRLIFLESGLNDESLSIRKIVVHLMITEWLVSYNDNYLSFLRALKLNGSDEELQRYHNTAKNVLQQIFKRTKLVKLLASLGCNEKAEEAEQSIPTHIEFCIPMEQLTLEHSVFWVNLAEYLFEKNSNNIDLLLPDLTTYCEYVTSCVNFAPTSEKPLAQWEELERRYIITNLVNNLKYFDYSDEIGKNNLKDFICRILMNDDINDHSIKTLLTVMETIVPDATDRFPILYNVINNMCLTDNFEFISERPVLRSILQNACNSTILLTISDLKVHIMDKKEQIADFLAKKDYENAEKSSEELNHLEMEYNKALIPLLKGLPEHENKSIWQAIQKTQSNTTVKCLKVLFFMLSSKVVNALTPIIRPFYSEFVRRFIESNQTDLRKWALKCGTTFALLHEQFSQDMFEVLRKQLLMQPNRQIWKVSIRGIFQLLVRYDLKFVKNVERNKSQTSTIRNFSQWYSQSNDLYQDDISDNVEYWPNVNLLSFMLHLLDTCIDDVIFNTIIEGLCLLCLNTKPEMYSDIISKLMITYFDPATHSKANQLLGVFFKKMIAIGKSIVLIWALLPTVNKILDAGQESTLGEVSPNNVIRFVINATNPKYCPDALNIHEIIAESFLREIQENLNTKFQLVKLLSSELIRLHVSTTSHKISVFLQIIDEIFIKYNGTEKVKQNLVNFQKLLSGELTHKMITEISANQIDNQSSSEITNQITNLINSNLSEIPEEDDHSLQLSTSIESNQKRETISVERNLRKSADCQTPPNMENNCPLYGSQFSANRRCSLRLSNAISVLPK